MLGGEVHHERAAIVLSLVFMVLGLALVALAALWGARLTGGVLVVGGSIALGAPGALGRNIGLCVGGIGVLAAALTAL